MINKDNKRHSYNIQVSGLNNLQLEGKTSFSLNSGESAIFPIAISIPYSDLKSSTNEINFQINSTDNKDINKKVLNNFIGPATYQ